MRAPGELVQRERSGEMFLDVRHGPREPPHRALPAPRARAVAAREEHHQLQEMRGDRGPESGAAIGEFLLQRRQHTPHATQVPDAQPHAGGPGPVAAVDGLKHEQGLVPGKRGHVALGGKEVTGIEHQVADFQAPRPLEGVHAVALDDGDIARAGEKGVISDPVLA